MKKAVFLTLLLGFSINPAGGQGLRVLSSTMLTDAKAVVIRGDYAYAAYNRGLIIIDISNPENPTMVGQCPIQGIGWDIALGGNYAYIASGSAYGEGNVCLHVIDISVIRAPRVVAGIDSLDYFSMGIAVSGNYAYLIGDCFFPWTNNFVVVDIFSPLHPLVIGGRQMYYTPTDIVLKDTLAYVAGDRSIDVVNIAHPHNPILQGSVSTANDVHGICIDGSYLYAAEDEWTSSTNFQIFSLSDVINPMLVGDFDAYCAAWGVSIAGDYAYLADLDSSLQIVNIADPAHPVLAGSYNPFGSTFNIVADGNYAYMVNSRAGVEIVDVSSPSDPEPVGRYGPDWNPQNVCISGNYAYVSQDLFYNHDHLGAVSIFDISNPAFPVMISEFTNNYAIYNVQVSGNYAYLASLLSDLVVLDISNPLNPVQIGQYYDHLYLEDLAVYGNYVYATSFNGLYYFNVTNPSQPVYLGCCSIYALNCVRVVNNMLYVTGASILYIYDLSNPAAPNLIENYRSDIRYDNIDVKSNYVFANGFRYFHILDVSNPTRPVLLSSTDASGDGSEICVFNGNAFFASSEGGFKIYDINNLVNPQLLVSDFHLNSGTGVAVAGDNIYLVSEYAFDILSYRSEGVTDDGYGSLLSDLPQIQAYPNPFNAQTTIRYTLPRASNLTIEIFDIAGRKVETLFSGHQEAGGHSVAWNTKDAGSGVYFYSIKAGGTAKTGKCVLLR